MYVNHIEMIMSDHLCLEISFPIRFPDDIDVSMRGAKFLRFIALSSLSLHLYTYSDFFGKP